MLIASKFHDYYDSITAYGIDKTVVYDRARHLIHLKERMFHSETFRFVRRGVALHFVAHRHIVGFCGQIYPVVEIQEIKKSGASYSQFLYSPEKVEEFLNLYSIKPLPRWRYFSSRRTLYSVNRPADMEEFFNPKTWDDLLPIFVEQNTPVFLATEDKNQTGVVINPCLKNMQFAKVKDPVTAFQSIYQYISGVLGCSAKPTVELSDKEMARKRGHDGKYSFKKPPKEKR